MRRGTLFATVAPLIALLIVGVAPVIAQSETSATPMRLTISDPARGARGHLTLRATLTTAEGKPLGDRQVTFYQQVDLFGTRDALIATGSTDSTGFAAVDYQPVENGTQTIKARFLGDGGAASIETSTTITVRDAVPVYTPDPLPLATVRQWLPVGLATLVLATWAVLLGVTLRTVLGIRRAEGSNS
jgi:hypothetical protein